MCCRNIYINNSSVVGPVLSCPAPQDNIFQPQVEGGNGSQTLNKYFPHFPVSSPPVSSPAGGQVVLRRKVSVTDIVLERRRERRQTAAVTRAGCQHTFLTARQMKGKLEGKKFWQRVCYLRVLHISSVSEPGPGFLTFTSPPIIWAEMEI